MYPVHPSTVYICTIFAIAPQSTVCVGSSISKSGHPLPRLEITRLRFTLNTRAASSPISFLDASLKTQKQIQITNHKFSALSYTGGGTTPEAKKSGKRLKLLLLGQHRKTRAVSDISTGSFLRSSSDTVIRSRKSNSSFLHQVCNKLQNTLQQKKKKRAERKKKTHQ